MEIERKFLINKEAVSLSDYPHKELEQGYLCTAPVVRVRKEGDTYYLTYKGKGMMAREEYNLSLTQEAYEHLIQKADGIIIKKSRYLIPFLQYTIELDVFHDTYEGLYLAEVEFPTIEEANSFQPPEWFVEDVTDNPKYHNSNLSKIK